MIKTNLFNSIFVIILFIKAFSSYDYPKDLPKCNRGDNDCIQNAIQLILTNYPHGNEALGLPSIDPVLFPQLEMSQNIYHDDNDQTVPIIIKYFATNSEFFGFSQAAISVEGFKADIDQSNNVTIKLDIPELIAKSDYVLERLQFQGRHHSGTGKYFAKLNDLQLIIKFRMKIIKKDDGKEYIKIENLNVDYIPQKSYAEFKESKDKQTAFIIENAKDFYEALRPSISNEWTKGINHILGIIFNKFSVDELFLD